MYRLRYVLRRFQVQAPVGSENLKMALRLRTFILTSAFCLIFISALHSAEKKVYSGVCTAPMDEFFINEVWVKVGAQKCLQSHNTGGDAEDSDFLLEDPSRSQGADREKALRQNRAAFAEMAKLKHKDESRILLKAVGKLKHPGKDVLKPDSAEYQV